MSEKTAAELGREPVWAEFQSLDGLKAMICVGSLGPFYYLPVLEDGTGLWTRDLDLASSVNLNIREYRLVGRECRGEGAFRKWIPIYREVAKR